MGDPDIFIDTALVDTEEELLFIDRIRKAVQPGHFVLASFQPAGRTRHRFLDIIPLRDAAGTFVKSHGDGGSKVGLDLHAFLRPHKDLMPVDVGLEMNAFFFDLPELCQ